jgi:3-deoxy-D-manno-octulosonic-acid transferase
MGGVVLLSINGPPKLIAMFRIAFFLYQLVLPVVCLLVAPAWLLKMIRRGGWGSGLVERLGIYSREAEFEKQGSVYVHAVSVGEVLLALKMIEAWRAKTGDHFTLVPTTATGMAVAREKAPDFVRVIYAPVDFAWLMRRTYRRFSPRAIVLVESELWPNLILQASRMGIPIGVVNARLSQRSEKRLRLLGSLVAPIIGSLDRIGVPEEADLCRWQSIGAKKEATQVTGNLKFDSEGATAPRRRTEFAGMIADFGTDRPVVMAVSTFTGEDEWLAEAFLNCGKNVLPVIVPRHAERREQAALAIEALTGRKVIKRSRFTEPMGDEVFLIDSTGELRDWTAHADVIVIGKSFLAKGGQNLGEAIQAGIAVISGPHMANFEPFVSELVMAGGLQVVSSREQLIAAVRDCLEDSSAQTALARTVAEKHRGAVSRTITLFEVAEGLVSS